MKRLAEELRTNGFRYTLHKRGERACIYTQHVAPAVKRYEVFLIRTRPKEKIRGKVYPEREIYPATREWGKTAWTYMTLAKAEKAFDEIENNIYKLKK